MTGTFEISPVAPLTALLRRWRLVLGLPLALSVLTAASILVWRGYMATSSFVPETSGAQRSQLAGLAMQLGIALAGAEPAVSLDFYRTLLQSRTLLDEAALTRYRFARAAGSPDTLEGSFLDLYQIRGRTEAARLRKAERRLINAVAVNLDRAAGVLTLETRARWPGLAEQLNRRLLQLVNTFNVERRNTSAAAQRDFSKGRLEEADSERQAAQSALRRFLERNVRYQDSPELVFEEMGLQKELDLRQQVYTQVAQSYEQARIDAVRNTPVITIIEQPEGSARPGRGVWLNAVLAAFFGLILAIGIVALTEYLARQRQESPEEFQELGRVWRDTIGRLKPRVLRGRRGAAADPDGRP